VRRIRFHSPDTIDLETDWNRLYYSTNRALHPQAAEVLQDSMIEFSRLPENGVAQIQVNLEPSLYVINAPRHHSTALFDVQPDAPLREVTFDIFDGRIVPDQVSLATGQVTINIRNRTGHSMVYSLMHDLYTLITTRLPAEIRPDEHHSTILPYVTAKDLATSQVFRDLFRAESIPSELGLSFKSVTFLFSDLKGSTQLYERVGDIRAYELVREHFILLQEIIQELGGAIVKTIGDAVMASFATPLPALEAALLINREIEKLGADEPLQVKMGIHTGSCIAVESNDRLDYFGRTVNIAARAQGVADAGEIVVTEAVYNSTGAVEAIQSAGMRAEGNCGMLKGIEDAIQLYRLS
jgi:class 3 adenylate cyclase